MLRASDREYVLRSLPKRKSKIVWRVEREGKRGQGLEKLVEDTELSLSSVVEAEFYYEMRCTNRYLLSEQ